MVRGGGKVGLRGSGLPGNMGSRSRGLGPGV